MYKPHYKYHANEFTTPYQILKSCGETIAMGLLLSWFAEKLPVNLMSCLSLWQSGKF